MKAYTLTDSEMLVLSALGVGATLAFALAAGLFGFWIDVSRDIDFAKDTPATILEYWRAAGVIAKYASAGCAVVGVALVVGGGLLVRKIKRETVFDVQLKP